MPDNGRTSEQARPFLFSFITFRQEQFGGLVFNPYLAQELELDPLESYVAALCDGRHTLADTAALVGSRYGLAPAAAAGRVGGTIAKLGQIAAVGMREGAGEGSRRPPDMQMFGPDAPPLSAPRSVVWELTGRCNLRCAHCLNASGQPIPGELSFAQLCQVAEQLAAERVLSVSLSGGEPFVHPRIIDLLEMLSQTAMRVDIATNGFHIPLRVLAALRRLPIFQVQVSIDGIDTAHDRLRGRAGAFAASCQTLRLLKAQGIATSISTTVTRDNIDMLDGILGLAVALGCSSYKAIPFMASGRGRDNAGALALTPEQHLRMCRWIAHNAERLRGTIAISTETTFTFLLSGTPSLCAGDGHVGCAAGYDTLCIAADGTVYPCPFLRDFPLGRVPGTQLREIWRGAPVLRRLRTLQKSDLAAPCSRCGAAPGVCGGGCRAAAFLATGDLCGVDPNCFWAAGLSGVAAGPAVAASLSGA